MNTEIINNIITEKIPCFFISPHFDDAVLSVGGLIAHLSRHTQVEVVNIFTQASERPYTLSARANLARTEYSDAQKLFAERAEEDRAVFTRVGITPINLGFADALYRKRENPSFLRRILGHILPEVLHIYPVYRFHITRDQVSRFDHVLIADMQQRLKELTTPHKRCYVFCPLALSGAHVDHLIVRDACLEVYPDAILWEDFPYNVRAGGAVKTNIDVERYFTWTDEQDVKREMIKRYKTQVQGFSSDGDISLVPEVYYHRSTNTSDERTLDMKRKKHLPTVSIGIPAYNEEANIGHLVHMLLRQHEKDFILKELVVVSDQSSDKTDEIVQKFRDPRVRLVRNEKRLGAALSQNVLVRECTGDILLMLDADVLPVGTDLINTMVRPFANNTTLGVVSSSIVPLPGRTFFENVINYSVEVKNNAYRPWKGGHNVFMCHGPCRAFGQKLLRTMAWPLSVSEDAFSYLQCIHEGYEFYYEPRAVINYRSPSTFADHLKQSLRFAGSAGEMVQYFPADFVKKEYALPHRLLITAALQALIRKPLLLLSYCMIQVVVRFYPYKRKYISTTWAPATSSKTLVPSGSQKKV